ncbi:MAG: hypothetical protein IPG02_11510 [Ignavibacteria bacterium]|nr:hypothetical protein [Ignavibacteria bacterium]
MKRIIAPVLIVSALIAIAYAALPLFDKKTENVKVHQKVDKASMLPRVLFLTTGTTEGNGEIAEGVSIAIQKLTKSGAFVWLGTREYLLQPERMSEFNVIIAPTSFDYHDGDRKYSLTFLSDSEMRNLANWVKEGGVLISEENIGRNTTDDVDRLSRGGELNNGNWPLSEVFGLKMREIDLVGFTLEDKNSGIWNGMIKDTLAEDEWAIVPTELISEKIKVLAEWKRGNEIYPAVLENNFGLGKAFLLTSTYMLHPSNDGGVSSVEQIERFYQYALTSLPGQSGMRYQINPWPDAHSSAGCITFNSTEDIAKYRMILDFLNLEDVSAGFVIDSVSTPEIISILNENKYAELISGLSSKTDFTGSTFSENSRAFIEIEQSTGLNFKGVRFPYRSSNFWGLMYASGNGYVYDASIGIDHLSGYAGSVFPYNIVLARDSFYKATDMLELCQIIANDFDYFQLPDSVNDYTELMQREDAALFSKYLLDFYEYVSKRNDGLIVFTGNPDYTAFSELTMKPLKDLIDELRKNNSWLATPLSIVEYRNKLKTLKISSKGADKIVTLNVECPDGIVIEGLSIKLDSRPVDVSTSGKSEIKEVGGKYFLITDVKNSDEMTIKF